MSSEAVIRVSGLSKCYLIYDKPQDRLKQYVMPRLQRMAGISPHTYYREFWALRNVSFEVPRGETVGIIGRNGSGKSTLLQMICGTLTPTAGTVSTQGRVAALLELGSGFNPEFTGLENIYMNAAVLGMDEDEIARKLDDIIAFADIGDHLHQPTKTYSSGMAVRLAFAVQALSEPDILVVDEALAVGDIKFQSKCFERLKQLKNRGTSILLVTHSSEQIVTHCSSAIMIEEGEIREIGSPKHVINVYHDVIFGTKKSVERAAELIAESSPSQADTAHKLDLFNEQFATHPGYNPHEYRWGDKRAQILDYSLSAGSAIYPERVDTGSHLVLKVAIRFTQQVIEPILGITVKNHEGVAVYGTNTAMQQTQTISNSGAAGQAVIFEAKFICNLAPGHYFISVGVASRQKDDIVPHDRRYDAIHLQVNPDPRFYGLSNLGMALSVEAS